MNLNELFELQAKLDERIYKEHPVQEGEDRLAKKILALQVELGELCQEWRGFKFWSHDQKPRIVEYRDCPYCGGHGVIDCFPFGAPDETHAYEEQCPECVGGQVEYNPLLEEYVDCLHFILSIGLELGNEKEFASEVNFNIGSRTIKRPAIKSFQNTFHHIDMLRQHVTVESFFTKSVYMDLFSAFTTLGDSLGFTEEQIEQAYLEKNEVNHERQESGY